MLGDKLLKGEQTVANDYDNLSTGTKSLKFIAGVSPAVATWAITKNFWAAAGVLFVGVVAGMAISTWYICHLSRNAHREADGALAGQEMHRVLRQSLPVFLWAPAVCGAVAALVTSWVRISN